MHTCPGKCCQESGETQPVRGVYPNTASVAREHVQRKEETQWCVLSSRSSTLKKLEHMRTKVFIQEYLWVQERE